MQAHANLPELRSIPVDGTIPMPGYPEERLDPEGINELAGSLRELGQLMPVLVTRAPDGRYQVVDGHRRIVALRQLGQADVLALISNRPYEELVRAMMRWRAIEDIRPPVDR